jgi:hypothetical protein
MEAVRTSETWVDNHFTWQYNPEDSSEQNTESLNLHKMGKEDDISILKDAFPVKLPNIKIVPITQIEIKSIIHSLKLKKKLIRLR